MGKRSVGTSGSRRSRRLARRQAITLSLAGLVLLLVTASALAVTGDFVKRFLPRITGASSGPGG